MLYHFFLNNAKNKNIVVEILFPKTLYSELLKMYYCRNIFSFLLFFSFSSYNYIIYKYNKKSYILICLYVVTSE